MVSLFVCMFESKILGQVKPKSNKLGKTTQTQENDINKSIAYGGCSHSMLKWFWIQSLYQSKWSSKPQSRQP